MMLMRVSLSEAVVGSRLLLLACIFVVVSVRNVEGQNQVPSVRALPSCTGTPEILKIVMDVDGSGSPYQNNDIPVTLPENITVTGNRPGMTMNDIKIVETSLVARADNLYSQTEGNVLIVPRRAGRALNDNPKGGRIKFQFNTPLYDLLEVRVIGLDATSRAYIVGRDRRNRKLARFNLPAPQGGGPKVSTVNPVEWFGTSELDVIFRGPGAVSELEVKVCRGGTFGILIVLLRHLGETNNFWY